MTRPKTPTQVLNLRGSFKKNPKRAAERMNEPKPTKTIGACPNHLSEHHKKLWNLIVSKCADGVLTSMDYFALEIIVIGLHEIRFGVTAFNKEGDEYLRPASSPERDRVFKQLGKFGLTPSERSNIVAQLDKPESNSKYGEGL